MFYLYDFFFTNRDFSKRHDKHLGNVLGKNRRRKKRYYIDGTYSSTLLYKWRDCKQFLKKKRNIDASQKIISRNEESKFGLDTSLRY